MNANQLIPSPLMGEGWSLLRTRYGGERDWRRLPPKSGQLQHIPTGGDTAYALGADDYSVFLGVSQVDGSGTVVALDLSTGQARWELPADSSVLSPAILTVDTLIAGLENNRVLAVDKLTGELLWELAVDEELSGAPTLTDTGLLLIPMTDGVLRATR